MAKEYNTYILKFPQNFIAGMLGFTARPYFESMEGAETASVEEVLAVAGNSGVRHRIILVILLLKYNFSIY